MTRRQALLAMGVIFIARIASAGSPAAAKNGRAPVESSSLASVGYDRAARVLEVEFRNGAVYRYREVPASLHAELMRADSKGKYFSKRIRGRFAFERVKEEKR